MENSNDIIKFNDFDNLEYRRGSKEFGTILTKLMDFLRMFDKGDMSFSINEFIEKSNITIDEITKLIESKKQGTNLFLFNIDIKGGEIHFTDFKNGKDRPFESNKEI